MIQLNRTKCRESSELALISQKNIPWMKLTSQVNIEEANTVTSPFGHPIATPGISSKSKSGLVMG